MKSDLFTIMKATTDGTLAETPVEFDDKNAACVIMASEGYPVSYEKGYEITIPADIAPCVFVAGAKEEDGKLLTSGGRVLGVTAIADSLQEAINSSYRMVEQIHFDNAFYRHDIGQRALKAKAED